MGTHNTMSSVSAMTSKMKDTAPTAMRSCQAYPRPMTALRPTFLRVPHTALSHSCQFFIDEVRLYAHAFRTCEHSMYVQPLVVRCVAVFPTRSRQQHT